MSDYGLDPLRLGDRVAGKVVVVTGAAGGQGAAQAILFAQHGAKVFATDVAEAPADEVTAAGRRLDLIYQRLDVTRRADWAHLATRLADTYGRADGLVNNAGVTCRARLLDVTQAELAGVFETNLIGPLLGIQAMAALMSAGSSIVNIGSVAAVTGHVAIAYTASKWALRGLSKAASVELGGRGIRVNMIHPGFIETPMTAAAGPAFRQANVRETPLGRTGTADEVARVALFLISDDSAYVDGVEIAVDGGMTAHGGAWSISEALR